jgi:hypothetical protein
MTSSSGAGLPGAVGARFATAENDESLAARAAAGEGPAFEECPDTRHAFTDWPATAADLPEDLAQSLRRFLASRR